MKKKNSTFKVFCLAMAGGILLSSCATIIGKSSYPVTVNTVPQGAKVEISDRDGILIYTGITPTTVTLEPSAGYFKKARYSVKLSKEGYQDKVVPITASLKTAYFGNLLLGGFIGMLIVDPASGKMYKIKTEQIGIELIKNTSSENQSFFDIININDLPEEYKDKLVPIN